MSENLTFDNYVYPLIDDSLLIANSDYNPNVPMSFALSVFHQDPKTKGLFSKNESLVNSNDELDFGNDYSGNLTMHITNCSSGNITLNTNDQLLTLYFDGEVYTGLVDSSSNISYRLTNSYHADASGHYSATIYDVTHGGKFTIYSNAFIYNPNTSNIAFDGSGGIVTIPLLGDSNVTRIHAVSISSYVTYVDPSGCEV